MASVKEDFMIYPNPTNGKLIIETRTSNTNNFTIFNVLGSEILKGKIMWDKFEINLENQPDGIYFIRIESFTQKIIKEF